MNFSSKDFQFNNIEPETSTIIKQSSYSCQPLCLRFQLLDVDDEHIHDFFVWYDLKYSNYSVCFTYDKDSQVIRNKASDIIEFIDFNLLKHLKNIDSFNSEISLYIFRSTENKGFPEVESMKKIPENLFVEMDKDCIKLENDLLNSHKLNKQIFLKILFDMSRINV